VPALHLLSKGDEIVMWQEEGGEGGRGEGAMTAWTGREED